MSAIDLLTDELRLAIIEHAESEAPRECCGLLLRCGESGTLHYKPCRNTMAGDGGRDRFRMDPEDYAAGEDFGEVVAIVHSHPNASANPSMADRVMCERSGVPWLVVGHPSGVIKECSPEGWQAPYVGREFAHGVLDCYTIIQDWFHRELAIALPDFEREDGWWERDRAQDLYRKHFAEAGFVEVRGAPQLHDVLVMQVRSDQANHGAVYIGDGRILHHLWGRLSCQDVYGGYWLQHTALLLRHRSLA